jgi:hypothetical protein
MCAIGTCSAGESTGTKTSGRKFSSSRAYVVRRPAYQGRLDAIPETPIAARRPDPRWWAGPARATSPADRADGSGARPPAHTAQRAHQALGVDLARSLRRAHEDAQRPGRERGERGRLDGRHELEEVRAPLPGEDVAYQQVVQRLERRAERGEERASDLGRHGLPRSQLGSTGSRDGIPRSRLGLEHACTHAGRPA